uniref:INO80 complex subunit B n=1 Tax=Equus caballus TaxID=9796 RepID=A0A9L0RBK5_HORSE
MVATHRKQPVVLLESVLPRGGRGMSACVQTIFSPLFLQDPMSKLWRRGSTSGAMEAPEPGEALELSLAGAHGHGVHKKKHKKHKKKHKKKHHQEEEAGPTQPSPAKPQLKLKIKLGGQVLGTKSVPTFTVIPEGPRSPSPLMVVDNEEEPMEGVPLEQYRAWLDEDSNLSPSPLRDLSGGLVGQEEEEEQRWLDALEKGELDDNGDLKKEINERLLTARQRGTGFHPFLPTWRPHPRASVSEAVPIWPSSSMLCPRLPPPATLRLLPHGPGALQPSVLPYQLADAARGTRGPRIPTFGYLRPLLNPDSSPASLPPVFSNFPHLLNLIRCLDLYRIGGMGYGQVNSPYRHPTGACVDAWEMSARPQEDRRSASRLRRTSGPPPLPVGLPGVVGYLTSSQK